MVNLLEVARDAEKAAAAKGQAPARPARRHVEETAMGTARADRYVAAIARGRGLRRRCRAHHSFAAEFDANQPVTLKGTVTKMEWINPHSWIHLDVKNPDGTVTQWMIEGGTPEHAGAPRVHEGVAAAGHRDHRRRASARRTARTAPTAPT